MFRFVFLFTLLGCTFAATINRELQGRIVGGKDGSIEDHSYQVSLQIQGFHICGGSIISEDIIVTAAHCLADVEDLMVRLGSRNYKNGGILVPVKNFRIHELYNPVSKIYDVAVIKLASPVQESSTIRFIKLAQATAAAGSTSVVTGWGKLCFSCGLPSETLQKVEVEVVDKESCSSDKFKYGEKIKETMICAYGGKKDSCEGDSGGPLVANNLLVGIVSWGRGCGREGYPGVYCDVALVHSWIMDTLKKL